MIRRPPRSTLSSSSAASDVYKRQGGYCPMDPSDASWLGPVLRAFPPFRASQCATHVRSVHRALGTAEIQTTQGVHQACMGLVAWASSPPANPVRPLAHGV